MVQGQSLEVVQEIKYLGVTLYSQPDFKHHIQKTINKIQRIQFQIYQQQLNP